MDRASFIARVHNCQHLKPQVREMATCIGLVTVDHGNAGHRMELLATHGNVQSSLAWPVLLCLGFFFAKMDRRSAAIREHA
jgi:hypothetical protein